MSIPFFKFHQLRLDLIEKSDLPIAQEIFSNNAFYHNNIILKSADKMAESSFDAPIPQIKDSKVFKYFLLLFDEAISTQALGVIDLYVGFPNYKIASIASLLIKENWQRKKIATRSLDALPALLQDKHPAVTTLSISITDNNIPALSCLRKNDFKRVDSFQKIERDGKSFTVLTFRKPFK